MLAAQNDADRFPFDTTAHRELERHGIELVEVAGHEPDTIAELARDAQAIFHYLGPFDEALIARLPKLRVIARMGAGFDSIDVRAARARGVEVVYTPHAFSEDVADHTIALLVACARRLASGDRAMRAGGWPNYAGIGAMHRLAGRTLGLVGYGRIGRLVGQKARAFGLELVAHDPWAPPETLHEDGVEAISLDELLQRSHVVSLHVALTDETHHLLAEREFARLPPGAIVLNTSRGPTIDETALVRALDSGTLAAAGIDVFESEPLAASSPLLRCETAVLTPHSASFTVEGLMDSRLHAIEDVARVGRGEPVLRPVPIA
jgi:phosphoglycerate dehydrogenase-like enzyme